MTHKESIDVVISFDTTGSMYPCLTQVRRNINDLVRRLHNDIPNLRVGIIAHGDYCDGPRAITKLDLTADIGAICKFVSTVESTGGGDAPECYELALHEARSFSWSAGKNKAVVIIGDEVPHPVGYPFGQGWGHFVGRSALDWRNELGLLVEAGIRVHGVQALGNAHARPFYAELARISGGCHLELHQFAHVSDLLLAICYKQSPDPAQFFNFEAEVRASGRMSRGMHQAFTALGGRGAAAPGGTRRGEDEVFGHVGFEAVHPSRFQVLDVPEDVDISTFVSENGLTFKVGRGFYQFTKAVKVQDHKEVVLVDKRSGDMFSGAAARRLLKLPVEGTVSLNPKTCGDALGKYHVMIQSTSANRKLLGGTKFLYEVDRADGRAW